MAMYSTGARGWTPVAHADGATALANNSYHSLATRAAGRAARVNEAYIGGEAGTSTVNRMAIRRASTNSATPTDVVPQALSPFSAAASAQGTVSATTGPTIASAPSDLLNLAFNAFGGVIRWVAAPGEEIYITGTTAPNSQLILDSISGTGVVSDHMIFEEM